MSSSKEGMDFTCITCSETLNEVDISKHLSSTRHKKVRYEKLNEIIECEECEDSNVHTLSVVRFGLSDMSLLCQLCLSKEEKPSTQYSLSNGSLFKKLKQYFQFRDIECQDCESDEHLFVCNNKKTKKQIIVCKYCLPQSTSPDVTFVSENDDNFLYELLGIKEFVPPKNNGRKGRSRKVGRRGGKGKVRKSKRVKPDAEERKAHYEKTKANSMAIKSGKTILAVDSEKSTPSTSSTSSFAPTPRSNTPRGFDNTKQSSKNSNQKISHAVNEIKNQIDPTKSSKDKQSFSKKKDSSKSSSGVNSTSIKNKNKKLKNAATESPESKSQDKTNFVKENKNSKDKSLKQNFSKENNFKENSNGNPSNGSASKVKPSKEKAINDDTTKTSNSKEKSAIDHKTSKELFSKNKKDKTTKETNVKRNTKGKSSKAENFKNETPKDKAQKDKAQMDIQQKDKVHKDKNVDNKAEAKKSKPKEAIKNKKIFDSNNVSKSSNSNRKDSKSQVKSEKNKSNKIMEELVLPPNISKYVPSQDPKLTYDSMNSYFEEMCYNLFLEETLSNQASNNDLTIDSSAMTIEWYADQDKKHKQFKLNIPLTDEILDRFMSKKMQSLKKAPFSLNQSVFLILDDKIPWYGQIVTVDTKNATKGRRGSGGLKILEMVIELYKWNNQPLPISVSVKWLKIMPVSIPVSRVFIAMSRIENPKFINMILGKEPIKQIVFKNYLKFTKETFNESQKVAIQSVLNNSITVLQGPPGTGKTSTIYEIILQLLDNLNTYPILVVAASNIAIDNIAEKLLEKHGRSILRIVANEKEKEYNREHPLNSICLHHKVYDALPLTMKQTMEDMRKFNGPKVSQNQYKKLLSKQIELSDIYIAQAKVIFTTTVVAGGNQLKSVKKLPVVIMDEATQSSEPTTLIPLSMPGVEKFVFVGDQKQLSSFSQVPNLSLSLFERVLLNKTYKTPHMLDTQYRMHPAISDFPRRKFYGGLLKDGITAEHRSLNKIPSNPIYVWDTCGKIPEDRVKIRFREDRGYTYVNNGEVGLIQKVLVNLIYDKGISKSDIGIITPYRGQRDLISSILVKDELINPEKDEIHVEVDRDDIYNDSKPVTIHTVSDILIASIDAFQGRERNFLIISCVRSNQENKIGFLNDERRLNVALTRAKFGLIVIGDVSCLSKGDPLWKEYLDDLQEKNSIFKSEDFNY